MPIHHLTHSRRIPLLLQRQFFNDCLFCLIGFFEKIVPTSSKAQIRYLQNKVKSFSDAREFYDPESGADLDRPTSLIKLLRFCVPRLCHAAVLDYRVIHRVARVLWEMFLKDQLFKKEYLLQCSTIKRIWHLRHCDLHRVPDPPTVLRAKVPRGRGVR